METPVSSSVCTGKWKSESAFFLFPWEDFNGYHSLNDNILSVLASVYLQSFLTNEMIAIPKRVYVFQRPKVQDKKPTSMFKLLHPLFSNQISPAVDILRDGPHCLEHVSWGSAMKPFYRDSLHHLRTKLFDLLKHTLSYQYTLPLKPSSTSSRPKVVIMSRTNTTMGSPQRKLARQSEEKLQRLYETYGAEVIVCCHFTSSTSSGAANALKEVTSVLWNADICIGIHGAGLANCVLGNAGMIIVELQSQHNYGFDSFMKIAHMAKGHFVFYDIRKAPIHRGDGPGSLLSDKIVQDLVFLSLGLMKYSKEKTLSLIERKIHRIDHHTMRRDYLSPGRKDYQYTTKDSVAVSKEAHRPAYGDSSSIHPITRYNENVGYVHKHFYKQELLLDMDTEELYLDDSMRSDATDLFTEYIRFPAKYLSTIPLGNTDTSSSTLSAEPLIAKSFRYVEASTHAVYKSVGKIAEKLTHDPSIMQLNEKNQINIKRVRSEISEKVQPYQHDRAEKREYFIFLNPYLHVNSDKVIRLCTN